jgi:hypothetical protein
MGGRPTLPHENRRSSGRAARSEPSNRFGTVSPQKN